MITKVMAIIIIIIDKEKVTDEGHKISKYM